MNSGLFRSMDILLESKDGYAVKGKEAEVSEANLVVVRSGETTIGATHDNEEQYYFVYQGEGVITLNDATYPIDENRFAFIPRNCSHSIRCTSLENLICVRIAIYLDRTPAIRLDGAVSEFHRDRSPFNALPLVRDLSKFSLVGEGYILYGKCSGKLPREAEVSEANVISLSQETESPLGLHPDEEEYYYVLGGRGEVTLHGTTYPAEKGSVVFIPRNCPHVCKGKSDEPFEYVCVAIYFDCF